METCSRRSFLKRGPTATAGFLTATAAFTALPTEAEAKQIDDLPEHQKERLAELAEQGAGQKAMLYDATLCIGCRACEIACNEDNQLGRTEDEIFEGRPAEDARALDTDVWTYVTFHQLEGDPSVSSWGKVQCMHCIEPACVSSCPVHALEKTDEGPVIYNQERCLGCRYCELACPFLVPRFEWETWNPYIRKCDMCPDRQADGRPPACVEACPTGSLMWGTREDLLEEAKDRIIASPRTYEHHIFGEYEAGGTNFLHIASRPFDQLGYRQNVPFLSYRDYTHPSMVSVPYVLSALALSLGAVAWMVNKQQHQDEEAEHLQEIPEGDES